MRRRADAGHAHAKGARTSEAGARPLPPFPFDIDVSQAKLKHPKWGRPDRETFHQGPSEVRSTPCGDTRSTRHCRKGGRMERVRTTRALRAMALAGLAVVLLAAVSSARGAVEIEGLHTGLPDLDTRTTEARADRCADNSCGATGRRGQLEPVRHAVVRLQPRREPGHRHHGLHRDRSGADLARPERHTLRPRRGRQPDARPRHAARRRGRARSAPRAVVRRRARRTRRARDSRRRRLGCRWLERHVRVVLARTQRLRHERLFALTRAGVGAGGERGRRAGLGRRRRRRRSGGRLDGARR